MQAMQPDRCDLERRKDGAILVRVHSSDPCGRKLPDAVFTFRAGDPQYDHWEELLDRRAAELPSV
jgi:hypothetical protein